MPPDVDRDPELLRAHSRAAADLACTLAAAADDADEPPWRHPADVAERERLTTALRAAVHELVALAADLAVAARVEHVDGEAAHALRRALR